MTDSLHSSIKDFLTFPSISEQVGAIPHFGRLILNDARSREYKMGMLLNALPPVQKPRIQRKWRSRWQGDQGSSSMCTAFALLHLFEHEPINHPRSYGPYKGKPLPLYAPRELYCKAQAIDPWPGAALDGDLPSNDPYDGTSVSAMMSVAKDLGIIESYWWEYSSVQTVVDTLLNVGPVIVGTNWTGSMMKPDKQGVITNDNSPYGGHCYLLDEIDLRPSRKGAEIGIFNSWGPTWGLNGRAYMSLKMFDSLLNDTGEACIAVEKP